MTQDKTVEDLNVTGVADLASINGGMEVVATRSGNDDSYSVDTSDYSFLQLFWRAIDAKGGGGGGEDVYIIVDGVTSGYETIFADGTTSSNATGHKIGGNTFNGRRTAGSVRISGGGTDQSPVVIEGFGADRESLGESSQYTLLEKNDLRQPSKAPQEVGIINGATNSVNDIRGEEFVVLGVSK